MNSDVKSGFMTSEFYVTLVTNLIPILMAFGIFQGSDAGDLTANSRETIAHIGGAIAGVAYIINRAMVKQSASKVAAARIAAAGK